MNEKEMLQGTITVEDLKQRKSDILAEIDRLQARLGEVEYWLRQLGSPAGGHWLLARLISEPLPVMTPAEEFAAKERAMKAHAEELAKGNAALAEAIDHVERKNGKPKETYGLALGQEYTGREIGRIWRSQHWEKKINAARAKGLLRSRRGPKRSHLYKAEALIALRNKQGK